MVVIAVGNRSRKAEAQTPVFIRWISILQFASEQ